MLRKNREQATPQLTEGSFRVRESSGISSILLPWKHTWAKHPLDEKLSHLFFILINIYLTKPGLSRGTRDLS